MNTWIVCYDISNNRKRKKTADILLNFGLIRVQKSVFEGTIKKGQFQKLRKTLQKQLGKNDSIRYYRLCPRCETEIKSDGRKSAAKTSDKTFFV